MTMSDQAIPLLVTHSGKFHCDEVFAYVVLRLALGLSTGDHEFVRTRDAAVIARGDVVWDVGSLYDEATNRFDHHQRGAPARDDGTPFSAAGLVWRRYGTQAVAALLGGEASAAAFAETIAGEIDDTLVRRIDELDNGVVPEKDTLGLAALIGDFNPSWDAPAGDAQADAAFLQAVAMADGVLRRRVESLRGRLAAEALVVAAQASSADPRILELERGMPWKNAVFAHNLPVAYAIYPVSNGNWMVDSMPPEAGSFEQRIPLPQAWAGLPETELAAVSGVTDAVFVHLRRFVGAAKTRAGAVAMARKAIAISEG